MSRELAVESAAAAARSLLERAGAEAAGSAAREQLVAEAAVYAQLYQGGVAWQVAERLRMLERQLENVALALDSSTPV